MRTSELQTKARRRADTRRLSTVAPSPPGVPAAPRFGLREARTTRVLSRIAPPVPGVTRESRGRRVFDVVFAALALSLATPVLAVVYVLHRVFEGARGPFLYRGIRLGLDRRPFVIYKVRTLTPGAERVLGSALHGSDGRFDSRFGLFLRRTRLDELPQFVNVLRGDMSVVGPRPERPEVYDRYRDRIPDYLARFRVKPGLTGLSQLVTPHGAPKRLRALLDHRFLRRERGLAWEARVIAATIPVLLFGAVRELVEVTRDRRHARASGPARDRRVNRRVSGYGMTLWPASGENATPAPQQRWRLLDVNPEAMCVAVSVELDPDRVLALTVEVPNWRTGRLKRARCRAVFYRESTAEHLEAGERAYVLFYEPLSEFQRYLFDQYVLKASLRCPVA